MTCDGIGMTKEGVTETEGCPIRSGMTEEGSGMTEGKWGMTC